jgi:acyl carrier protein
MREDSSGELTAKRALAALRAAVADVLSISDEIGPDTELADLDLDPVDAVELTRLLQERLGVRLESRAFRRLPTVGLYVEYLAGKLVEAGGAKPPATGDPQGPPL